MLKVKPNKPFRAKYFSSNLTGSEETQKDFAYFNNASSIFAGREIFNVVILYLINILHLHQYIQFVMIFYIDLVKYLFLLLFHNNINNTELYFV